MADQFTHQTVFVISSFNEQGECVNQQMETLDYPASFAPRFTVHWYVNNQCTYTVKNVRAEQAYDMGIPPEAIMPTPGNRWHVMMRNNAIEQMNQTNINQLAICFQDPLPGYDTERVVVTRASGQV
jgi:hypothetical protein